MSVEIHDRMIKLLSSVEEFKGKEGELKAERQRHVDQIALSEAEVERCNAELDDIRENQLRLRREMDGLRDDLFRHEEDETIALDEAHTPSEDGASTESDGRRLWRERQRTLKTVQ
jgi:hypothetical protein